MKKLVLLFLWFNASAQNPTYLHICKVYPDTLCAGDTATIAYTIFNGNTLFPNNTVSINLCNSSFTTTLLNSTYVQLAAKPKNSDSCKVVKVTIPYSFQLGPSFLLTPTDYFPIFVRDCGMMDNVGLKEYQLNGLTPTYYDLQGNKTETLYNQLIIQQIGNTRKKVFIQN